MEEKQDKSGKSFDPTNFDELIYRHQKERLLHPMWIIFTKEGFIWTLFFLFSLSNDWVGLKMGIFIVGGYYIVYRSYFNYSFSELEQVWGINIIVGFLTKRIEPPFKTTPLLEGDFLSRYNKVDENVPKKKAMMNKKKKNTSSVKKQPSQKSSTKKASPKPTSN